MQEKSSKTGHTSKAAQIVARVFESGAVPRSIAYVQGWFVSGDSADEIDKALWEAFEKGVCFESAPRGELVDALPRLREKAGYDIRRRSVRRPGSFWWGINRAAAVLLPLAAVIMWSRLPDIGTDYPAADMTAVAADESELELTLPDGSQVRLAPGASLEYAVNFTQNRSVKLYGEAYFTVAETDGELFTADCGALTVTVTGTQFLLRSAEDGLTAEIRLTEGAVTAEAGGQIRKLTAGQVLTFDGESGEITVGVFGKGEQLKLQGLPMTFDDESLEEVFASIEQYHGVTIEVLPGVDIRRRLVVGFVGGETPGDIMLIIRAITGNAFDYTVEGNKITVSPSDP